MINQEKIKINSNSQVTGVNNIKLSCVDDIIYISNTNTVSSGIPNSIAVYDSFEGSLISSGEKLSWDCTTATLSASSIILETASITDRLTAPEITSTLLTCSWIKGKTLDVDYIEGNCIISTPTVKLRTLAFLEDNKLIAGFHILNHQLAFSISEKDNVVISFDNSNRIIINGKLNINPSTNNIMPRGLQGDQKGDILINNNYIYYCTANYTGRDNIWVRWAVTETDWED